MTCWHDSRVTRKKEKMSGHSSDLWFPRARAPQYSIERRRSYLLGSRWNQEFPRHHDRYAQSMNASILSTSFQEFQKPRTGIEPAKSRSLPRRNYAAPSIILFFICRRLRWPFRHLGIKVVRPVISPLHRIGSLPSHI